VTSPIWGTLDEVEHLKTECSRFEKYSDPKVLQAQKTLQFQGSYPNSIKYSKLHKTLLTQFIAHSPP
jgi:hypothetical protein